MDERRSAIKKKEIKVIFKPDNAAKYVVDRK